MTGVDPGARRDGARRCSAAAGATRVTGRVPSGDGPRRGGARLALEADRARRRRRAAPRRSFGYAPTFTRGAPGRPSRSAFVGSWAHGVEVGVETAAWIVVAAALAGRRWWLDWWWGPHRAERGRRRRRRAAAAESADAACRRRPTTPSAEPTDPPCRARCSRGGDVTGSLRRALMIAVLVADLDRHRDRRPRSSAAHQRRRRRRRARSALSTAAPGPGGAAPSPRRGSAPAGPAPRAARPTTIVLTNAGRRPVHGTLTAVSAPRAPGAAARAVGRGRTCR